MGSRQFVQNDSDLLGLLQKNSVRVIRELNHVFESEGGIATGDALEELREEKNSLRDELLRNIDGLQGSIDSISVQLNGNISAGGDIDGLASLVETLRLTIQATAARVEEVYEYAQDVETADALFQTSITGTICRGFLNDPGGGSPIFGIAIAEKLAFTAEVVVKDNVTYYGLDSSQTLGIYTSTGWQFWMNGEKVGWFDSQDGQLHVTGITVEGNFRMGDWLVTTGGGWGLRYVGG